MALLGDHELVKTMLRAHETFALDTDIDARLLAIQAAITPLIEQACGRVFGDEDEEAEAADTSELHWAGPYETLILTRPARSITSITYGGTISGTTMTGGTTVLAADLIYDIVDPMTGNILGIRRVSGGWWGGVIWPNGYRYPVVVTGDFSTSPGDAEIPDEIQYAANLLIAETYRRENGMPSGVSGPDGSFNVTDPWQDPAVVKAIARNRVASLNLVV